MPSFMGSVPKVKPMKSLISLILSAIIFISLQVQAREAQTLYNQSCIACHASGAAGAPKKGDAAAWAPRLAQGPETLLKHTKEGINAMPPKGMCMDCTDDEFKALIQYMSSAK
jgi:cytochrome c5